MNSNTWRSKTFWGGIATVATGVGLIVAGAVVEGVQTVTLGVLAIFGRDAVAKIQRD